MSIFDKFNKEENHQNMSLNKESKVETFVFKSLPESLDEMKQLKESTLDSPFKTAALTVLALCVYGADKNIGIQMLNYLRGPRPLSNQEISFLNDRFMDNKYYLPFSYFEGATPENDYTPNKPYTLKIYSNDVSNQIVGYSKLLLYTKGADNPRFIQLRGTKNGMWYLWEQFILVGIKEPKSNDPWM